MRIELRGENLEITAAIREYVETKLDKVEKYFENTELFNAHVNLKVYKQGQKVEVTIITPGLTLRAEEINQDVYAAMDIVIDKLERQIRKHKTKVNRKHRQKGNAHDFFAPSFPEAQYSSDEEEDDFSIRRRKSFELQPMTEEEAILQMNMLGHDFFLYINGQTGQTNVVYRRNQNSYGIIEAV